MVLDIRLTELLQLGRASPVRHHDLIREGDGIGSSLAAVRHNVEGVEVGNTSGELLLDRSGHLVNLNVLSLIVVVNRTYREVLSGNLIADNVGEGLAHSHIVGHGCLDPLAIVREEAAEISGYVHRPDGGHQVGERLRVDRITEELAVLLVCHLTAVRADQTEEARSNVNAAFGLTFDDHLTVEHVSEDSVGSRLFESIGSSDGSPMSANLAWSLDLAIFDQLQSLKELLILHEGGPMIQNGENFAVIIYEEAFLTYGGCPQHLEGSIEIVLSVDVDKGLRNPEEIALVTQLLF